MRITIEPNVGKGAVVEFEEIPTAGDWISWEYESRTDKSVVLAYGTVLRRQFDQHGNITLHVKLGFEE